MRFIILNTNQHLVSIKHEAQHFRALHDFGSALAHQHVIAGNIRLALRAVQDQCADVSDRMIPERAQLEVAGERRAAQPHHAGHAQKLAQLSWVAVAIIDGLVCYPFLLAVGD